MELYGNRHNERYIFRRVKWPTFEELEEYPYIIDGSLEFSADADMKITGTFNFEGFELPNVDDLMRVYYEFTDDNGEKGTYPIGTFFVGYSDLEYTETIKGLKAKGTLNANSTLKCLEDALCGKPYVINRGQNYIYEAQKICQQFKLPVEYVPDWQALTLDHVFDAGTSYLEIVNWLTEQAGYLNAYPNEMGVIQLQPASALELTEITLQNDSKSIIYPTIKRTNDFATTPNVVRYIYDTEHSSIVATAKNLSGSRNSIDAMGGREITEFDDLADLPSGAVLLDALKERARQRVVELSADVEYVDYEHAYIPMQLYQPITLKFSDLDWSGTIDNYTIDLKAGTRVQSKLKRVLEENVTVEVTGEIIRNEDNS